MNRQQKKPARLDYDKIAKGLGAKRKGLLKAKSGWHGAIDSALNRPSDDGVASRVDEILTCLFGPKRKPK